MNLSLDNQQDDSGLSLVRTAPHANPKRGFVAGLASGATMGAAALDQTEKETCVEISPKVVRAASDFADYNYDIGDDMGGRRPFPFRDSR